WMLKQASVVFRVFGSVLSPRMFPGRNLRTKSTAQRSKEIARNETWCSVWSQAQRIKTHCMTISGSKGIGTGDASDSSTSCTGCSIGSPPSGFTEDSVSPVKPASLRDCDPADPSD
ncbi:unnamed protein product, partial [Mycena citricolor]